MTATLLQVVGFGASTPVGRNVWSSAAAVRAGLSGFTTHPFMMDTAGEPMRIARAPWLDVMVQGPQRYMNLLLPAIDEVIAAAGGLDALKDLRLGAAIALPPQRPGRPPDLGEQLSHALTKHYGHVVGRVIVREVGHAAGYVALDGAMRGLANASLDGCIVGGVDSYISPETLEWIEASEQLHGAGPLNNAWGFIPGEAAGAMLITMPHVAERLGIESLADLVGIGLGREVNRIKTDSVCIGEGLTTAFRAAVAALGPTERIHNIVCDLNGETYRADEFGFTALRMKQSFRTITDFVAPADVWGDVGAAGAPLHLALAAICHLKGYGKGPLSITWASSESGERGAALIRARAAQYS